MVFIFFGLPKQANCVSEHPVVFTQASKAPSECPLGFVT